MDSSGDKVLGVVDQISVAFKPRNRLATVMGFLLGGVVPVATYLEAHCDLDKSRPVYAQIAAYLVLGGLLFSAKTVFAWAKMAFQSPSKSAGFVLLLEGVMIASSVPVLPLVLLAILVGINGVATGCILSLGRAKAVPVERAERAPRVKKAPASRKRRISGVDLKVA